MLWNRNISGLSCSLSFGDFFSRLIQTWQEGRKTRQNRVCLPTVRDACLPGIKTGFTPFAVKMFWLNILFYSCLALRLCHCWPSSNKAQPLLVNKPLWSKTNTMCSIVLYSTFHNFTTASRGYTSATEMSLAALNKRRAAATAKQIHHCWHHVLQELETLLQTPLKVICSAGFRRRNKNSRQRSILSGELPQTSLCSFCLKDTNRGQTLAGNYVIVQNE